MVVYFYKNRSTFCGYEKENGMKKKLALIALTLVLVLTLSLVLTACQSAKYAGVYEMESVTGYMIVNGQRTELDASMYEYYRVTLKKNGDALIESKPAGVGGAIYEAEGEWKYQNGKIRIKSTVMGVTGIEEMTIEGDTLTYTINQTAQGVTMSFTLVMKKSSGN